MQIWIGTSGFQYKEWKGKFYPEDLSEAKMLGYYAERFSTTEINYTFRHTPSLKSIQSWSSRTPGQFRFAFKAPQSVTHFAKLRDCGDKVAFFEQAIAPMASKLGPVLFQLPPSFKANLDVLNQFLSGLPKSMRAAFEFRHASWFEESVYAALRQANAALCIAEDEKLATPAVATAKFGYLRLRREDYETADLERWATWIQEQASAWSDVYIYLKHEEQGLGPKFAQLLQEQLKQSPPR
jgi:uncharacterized protein YecE (DUF72 family)